MKTNGAAHMQTWQKYWCKVLIKVQQPLIKVPSRTYWNRKLVLKIENCFFLCPGAIGENNIFIINCIWNF